MADHLALGQGDLRERILIEVKTGAAGNHTQQQARARTRQTNRKREEIDPVAVAVVIDVAAG